MAKGWTGTIYASSTVTGDTNSGWLNIETIIGLPSTMTDPVVSRAWLRMVPADLATDETLDLDLNVAFDSSGTGDVKIHDFTQVDSNNTAETLVLPGGESTNLLQVKTSTGDWHAFAPIPPFWKFAWTLGGTTKSMSFTVYGTLELQ